MKSQKVSSNLCCPINYEKNNNHKIDKIKIHLKLLKTPYIKALDLTLSHHSRLVQNYIIVNYVNCP